MAARDPERTRARILAAAMDVASRGGLGEVTHGQVARDADLSRGAVANHYPTVAELHHATVEAAAQRLGERLMVGMAGTEPGLQRLRAGLEAWLTYLADPPFAYGCVFSTTTVESAHRAGPATQLAATTTQLGLHTIAEQARVAVRQGELVEVDADQLAFELHAFLQQGNWWRRLFDDPTGIDRARTAIEARIDGLLPDGS